MFGDDMSALLGLKLGMTRVFDEKGRSIPVTAILAGPCVVTQTKTIEKDGYTAVQIGFGTAKHPNQPEQGHAKSLSATPQHLREFRALDPSEYSVGQTLDSTVFEKGATLKLTGTSKGKGFSGVIKRHNFSRGPETHGSDHHRAPGSIGAMFPQHVLKGMGMPGKMGHEQISIRKVKIVDIIADQNLILVKGPVPGVRGALIEMATM
jgi:large subunit ribosomal protein L3